jgi:intron-binding protein aquarius
MPIVERFVQVEAIRSGCNPGLTMVVGPPGTGKTDVAVQIIVNLYQQFPGQRTLIVTHSNQALNDLFAKIQQRAVDERYLLRLGHGQSDLRELAGERDFSKLGRVNHMLQRRLDLLAAVTALARALGLTEDAAAACAATCETAAHFRLHAVAARWEQFLLAVERQEVAAPDAAQHLFPFGAFLPHLGLHAEHGWALAGADLQADLRLARLAMRRIDAMFDELEECRPFELLRSFKDRGDLLLTRHAKVRP